MVLRDSAKALRLFLFACCFAAAASAVGQSPGYDFDHPVRPAETSDCPANSVYVPGSRCIAEGRPSCSVITRTPPSACGSGGANIRLSSPLGSNDPLGDPPAEGGSCSAVRTIFWAGLGEESRLEIGDAACVNGLNSARSGTSDPPVYGCCFSCAQGRQSDGFCQAVPGSDTPDCARPGFAYSNPGACRVDPSRPDCLGENCTENFAGSSCCVAGSPEDNGPPEVPPGRERPPVDPPIVVPPHGGDRPNTGKPAGPGNRPPGPGVTGSDGTLDGGDSSGAPSGQNSAGHRNVGASGLAVGVSRYDACTLAKRFLTPCAGLRGKRATRRGNADENFCVHPLAREHVDYAYAEDPTCRLYYDYTCETFTPDFNDDCDATCDECDEFALKDLSFVQCPGNEPPADDTQTSVKLGETWYCNAVVSGDRWCAAPRLVLDGVYDFSNQNANLENPCSVTKVRVPVPPPPPEDAGPGDVNGYCTEEKIEAEDPACVGVETLGGDVNSGLGGGSTGYTFTFESLGVTLEGVFSIPAVTLNTVFIDVPPGLTRKVTVSGVEFVIFDQSVLRAVVSLAFCEGENSQCVDELGYNPLDTDLITSYVSGTGLEDSRAVFVFGDEDNSRFTATERPNCVEPIFGFAYVFGYDLDEFVSAAVFDFCDVLEGDTYGTDALTLADLIQALNIFAWLFLAARIFLES